MKTLILTIATLVFSVSLYAQDYAVVLNSNPRTDHKVEDYNQFTNFTSQVMLTKEFNYRDFLKSSKNSKETFNVDGKIISQKELVKLLRKGAVKSQDLQEFKLFLSNSNLILSTNFSEGEMFLLYDKFRVGTFTYYINDLADNWEY